MTASIREFNLRYNHFQRHQWEYYVAAPWVPYHELRDNIILLARGKGSLPRTNDLARLPVVTESEKQTLTVLWVSSSPNANRRLPNP